LQAFATSALRQGLIAYDRREGWRGPVARIDDGADWSARLEGLTLPAGAEGWDLAVVLDLADDSALVGLGRDHKGRIPLAELKWARKSARGQFVGPPIGKPADALRKGDVVLVEPLPGQPPGRAENYALRQIPDVQGALAVLDPHTGRTLALVGGFSARSSVFNRATQALRQPGSAFKPFVYLAALDQGFTPSSLILDAPFALDQGAGLGKWKPANYTEKFYGPTPLRIGIEKSRNVMTVRLAQYMGMGPVADVARRFNIHPDLPQSLSMALGAGETTVLRLTAAYGMLVNGGKRIEPSFIDRVQDREGQTVYRHDRRSCQGCQLDSLAGTAGEVAALNVPLLPDERERVADPRTAYQIVSMLEGVIQRGTGARIKELGKPLAGKTGTTNDAMDVWFVGFAPDLVAGIFVGYDQPRSLGDNESGSSIAVPIFKDFMANALKDKPAAPFRIPPGLRLMRIDPETGRPAAASDRSALWEAFIPGTEPREGEGILDGSDGAAAFIGATPQTPLTTDPAKTQSIGTGTGTIY
jgi:penicillin-binding protein 1A